VGQRLGRRGTEETGHKRRKRAKKKGVKHRTEVREHKINCLIQMIEDKEKREEGNVAKATPPSTCIFPYMLLKYIVLVSFLVQVIV
jgi:hypothetical protein